MRAPLIKKLWIGTGAVTLFVGILLAFSLVASSHEGTKKSVGLDFIAFYTAGTFVHQGHAGWLYDIRACQHFQHDLAASFGIDLGSAVGPWWNPPFYAWVFVPLAGLPYLTALRIWLAIDVACAAAACWMLVRMLPRGISWKQWLLVPVLVALSMPFIQCMTHAQNSCTSLLILTAAVSAWRSRRGVLAGMALGLLFYKPQLAAVLAAVLIFDLGWPALAGLAIVGSALLAITIFTLPGTLGDFLHRLPANVAYVQTQVPYMWDRHVTIKAFWRLMLQGREVGPMGLPAMALAGICECGLGIYLLRGMWAYWRSSKKVPNDAETMHSAPAARASRARDRLIAAAIAATPLLMPFYFDYDQLLLAIPAVLLAAEYLRRSADRRPTAIDRALMIVWPIYYFALILTPAIAETAHVNLAVPLLAMIASFSIAKLSSRAPAAIATQSTRLSRQAA